MKRKRGIIGRLLAAAMAAVLVVSSMPANVYAEGKEDVSFRGLQAGRSKVTKNAGFSGEFF